MDSDLPGLIRASIASDNYTEALRLWNAWAAQIREDLASGKPSQPSLAAAAQLVAWTRTSLLCKRAHAQRRLNTAYVAGLYTSP